MINLTKKYVSTVSLIISILLFYFLNDYIISKNKFDSSKINNFYQYQPQIEKINNSINKITNEPQIGNIVSKKVEDNIRSAEACVTKERLELEKWKIEIQAINLQAPISEGTSKEVMDEFVGHFEETPKDVGNIGLAAHNRGYKVNYFKDLKNLKKGDEIVYTYNSKKKIYVVNKTKIIKDTDWKLLENTKDNRLTLITCVENQPEYRRCIQAIEKK